MLPIETFYRWVVVAQVPYTFALKCFVRDGWQSRVLVDHFVAYAQTQGMSNRRIQQAQAT